MSVDSNTQKVSMMRSYMDLQNHPAFKDLVQYMNEQNISIWNEFLKPQDCRAGKESHEVLQGRGQMLSMVANHMAAKVREGENALKRLAAEKEKS